MSLVNRKSLADKLGDKLGTKVNGKPTETQIVELPDIIEWTKKVIAAADSEDELKKIRKVVKKNPLFTSDSYTLKNGRYWIQTYYVSPINRGIGASEVIVGVDYDDKVIVYEWKAMLTGKYTKAAVKMVDDVIANGPGALALTNMDMINQLSDNDDDDIEGQPVQPQPVPIQQPQQAVQPQPVQSPPVQQQPQQEVSQKKFCPFCGAKLVAGAKFCPECGKQI